MAKRAPLRIIHFSRENLRATQVFTMLLFVCIQLLFFTSPANFARASSSDEEIIQQRQQLILEPDAEFIRKVPEKIQGDSNLLPSSDCSCSSELLEVRRELQELREDFQTFKDTQLETFLGVTERVHLIVSAFDSGAEQIAAAKKHAAFLHDHILDESLLERTSRQILRSLLYSNSSPNSTVEILTHFAPLTPPSLHLPLYNFLFDELDSRKLLENFEVLRASVRLLHKILEPSSNFPPSSPLTSRLWTKEVEIKIINRLTVNLLIGLPAEGSNSDKVNNHKKWLDLRFWLNSRFFSSFRLLTEQEGYEVFLDTIQTQGDDPDNKDKVILSQGQLGLIKDLYYSSFLPNSTINNPYFVVHARQVNRTMWQRRRDVFARPLLFNSIDGDILTRATQDYSSNNGTPDGSIVCLRYMKIDLNADSIWYGGFDPDDFYFAHFADVCLHAVANGVMTYEPRDPNFWKLIRAFEHAESGESGSILTKYPFLIDEVKTLVFDLYNTNSGAAEKVKGQVHEGFDKSVQFIQSDLPQLFKVDGLKQLTSLMREDGQLYRGNQVFQLADLMMTYDLRNHSLWTELPEQVQLLSDYSSEKGLLWQVRVTREVPLTLTKDRVTEGQYDGGEDEEGQTQKQMREAGYELEKVEESKQFQIFVQPDFSLGFSETSRRQNTVRNFSSGQGIWLFDTTFVPALNLVRSQISLADSPPSLGGLVIGTDLEDPRFRIVRHVTDMRDRRNGKFAVFWPVLSGVNGGASFHLNFGKSEHVAVLLRDEHENDEENAGLEPLALTLGNKMEETAPPPAEFIVYAEK